MIAKLPPTNYATGTFDAQDLGSKPNTLTLTTLTFDAEDPQRLPAGHADVERVEEPEGGGGGGGGGGVGVGMEG